MLKTEPRLDIDAPLCGKPTPFRETGRTATCCSCSKWVLIVFFSFFVVWNMAKVPFYYVHRFDNVTYDAVVCNATAAGVGVPNKACYGFEFEAHLGTLTSWRDHKLITSPINFLSPHTTMACLLEAFFIAALLCGFGVVRKLSYAMLPLVFVFGLHILPVQDGFPTRTTGKPINLCCVIVLWIAAIFGAVMLLLPRSAPTLRQTCDMGLYWVWIVIGFTTNLAPLGECALLLTHNGSSSPDGNVPLPQSGHDAYSSIGTWFGITLTVATIVGGIGYFVYFQLLLQQTARLAINESSPLISPLYNVFFKRP